MSIFEGICSLVSLALAICAWQSIVHPEPWEGSRMSRARRRRIRRSKP